MHRWLPLNLLIVLIWPAWLSAEADFQSAWPPQLQRT